MTHIHKKISVIIPVYNGEQFIEKTIQNVLNQNYSSIELIVVDDGSTDSTANILKKQKNILYLYQSNKGPSSARNLGLQHAKGEFIIFLDSDDYWEDASLLTLSKYLTEHQDVQIIDGKIRDFNQNNDTNELNFSSETYYMCNLGSCLIRSEVFQIIGNFEEQLFWGEDVDWYTRAWENNIRKERIDTLILNYRKHSNSLTNTTINNNQHFRLLLFKLKLDRAKKRNYIPNGLLIEYIGEK